MIQVRVFHPGQIFFELGWRHCVRKTVVPPRPRRRYCTLSWALGHSWVVEPPSPGYNLYRGALVSLWARLDPRLCSPCVDHASILLLIVLLVVHLSADLRSSAVVCLYGCAECARMHANRIHTVADGRRATNPGTRVPVEATVASTCNSNYNTLWILKLYPTDKKYSTGT